MAKYVGEEGDKCKLSSLVIISTPFDLVGGSISMHRALVGKFLYSKGINAQNHHHYIFFRYISNGE